MATVDQVAESLITLSHQKQKPITNLKLQKLLYYSQAWHLAFYGIPLFDEEIEAWAHGPVVPQIFRRYRSSGWNPISDCAMSTEPSFKAHINEVWRVYGHLGAFELERLTHSEEPWKLARTGLPPDASSNQIITKLSMQRYYSLRLNG